MRQPTLSQRLKAKRRTQTLIIGVTWYTEETWSQVKATATDPNCFEESFEKWKTMAVLARREFQRSGVRALEFLIDPADFAAWCAENNQENNATARSEFVSVRLSALHEGKA